MADTVLMERRGEVALLTLNRPNKLNALNYETNDLLVRLLDRIEADRMIRAVVLTGAGPARAHVATRQAHVCVERIAGHTVPDVDPTAIPSCQGSSPSSASIESIGVSHRVPRQQ